jgi:NitT/TauT family transport system substrate-binding protein
MNAPSGAWNRRDLLRLALAAPCLGVAGCSTQPDDPLVIATAPWGSFQFMGVAAEEGWLSPAVRLQRQRTSFDMMRGLREGRVDAATITLDQTLQLVGEGLDLVVVLIADMSAGADVVVARPEVATLADLRGKRIGFEATALGHVMLAKLLEAARLQRSDVEAVPMGTDHVTSWLTLQPLDAVITYEPSLRRLEEVGLVRLFDSRSVPQTILDVLTVIRRSAAAKRPAVESAVAGHFRALARWQSNPVDTAYRLAPLIDVPAERVAEAFRGVDLPDIRYNRHLLAPPATELRRASRDIVAILQQAGVMRSKPAIDELFDASYLPRGG